MDTRQIYGPAAAEEFETLKQEAPLQPSCEPEKEKPFSFVLSDGKEVVFYKAKADCMFKARKIAGSDQSNTPYIAMTMMTTFNGQKITLEDIKNLDLCDFFLLEEKWNEFCSPKKPAS